MKFSRLFAFLALAAFGSVASAQFTSAQRYTRYELLDPADGTFRIFYDVSANAPGSQVFFNPVRRGSAVSDVAVIDRATGTELEFELVAGASARDAGYANAKDGERFLKVELPRPVPEGGEVRIQIQKTYADPESFFAEGDDFVFKRTLGIRRNAVLLPEGCELIECNTASQVLLEPSGRLLVSFMNPNLEPAPFRVRMRPLPDHPRGDGGSSAAESSVEDNGGQIGMAPALSAPDSAPADYSYPERAVHDRDIVYYLRAPETHSFRLYHDYTERREGVDRYLNIVRPGSRATDPEAILLDTGQMLEVNTYRGEEIAREGIELDQPITEATEVVLIQFPAVKAGQNTRLRITETYTDPNRYGLMGEVLVWARSFGRNRNRVVLPEGWYLTDNAIPATIALTEDGRVQLDYVNPRPDSIYVVIKAQRR